MPQESETGPGRPTKFTDERVKILLECLEDNMPLNKACDYAKIARQTIYNWMKEDENFSTQVSYAKSAGERRLVRKVEDKDPWKILKNTDPENFKDEPAQVFNFNGKETITLPDGTKIEDKR